jgi:putative pyoverdin transport system ATP-binding/permease protein
MLTIRILTFPLSQRECSSQGLTGHPPAAPGFTAGVRFVSLRAASSPRSPDLLPFALAISLVSGTANAALVALISQALRASGDELLTFDLRFAALGLVVLVTCAVSQMLSTYLRQQAKARLRLQTIGRIAGASYRDLERCGASRAINARTQYLDTIVVYVKNPPSIAMQGAVIAGCLVSSRCAKGGC